MSEPAEPVDLDTLLATYMQNRSIIKAILDAFKESFDNFESEYHRLQADNDNESLKRLVHSLKGSSGNLRANQVYGLSQELEAKMLSGAEEVEISESFSQLVDAMSELMNYIDNFTD